MIFTLALSIVHTCPLSFIHFITLLIHLINLSPFFVLFSLSLSLSLSRAQISSTLTHCIAYIQSLSFSFFSLSLSLSLSLSHSNSVSYICSHINLNFYLYLSLSLSFCISLSFCLSLYLSFLLMKLIQLEVTFCTAHYPPPTITIIRLLKHFSFSPDPKRTHTHSYYQSKNVVDFCISLEAKMQS